MEKYNNLMSELDQENLNMIAKQLPDLTDKNLNNIKKKFRDKTMNKKGKFKKRIITGLSTAACICVAFIGVVNINTSFAAQLIDIPAIGTITKLVTIDKLALNDKYREINIEIPAIEGIEDAKAQEEINSILKQRGIAVYDKALENSDKLKDESEKAGFLSSMPEIVNQSYTVIRNDEDILSFKVVTTKIRASGYETAHFYNVDLRNSKLLKLSDLFNKDYDYISVINNEIISKMKEAIKKEDAGFFIEHFTTIDDNTNFYINEEGNLVIVFNEYEIAAGYMGMAEFIIDTSLFDNNISGSGYYLK